MNVASELRTVPEIIAYLDARRSLSFTDPGVVGDERALFGLYLLNGGSLAGCVGKADAAVVVAARQGRHILGSADSTRQSSFKMRMDAASTSRRFSTDPIPIPQTIPVAVEKHPRDIDYR
jgi:hypothetical protein